MSQINPYESPSSKSFEAGSTIPVIAPGIVDVFVQSIEVILNHWPTWLVAIFAVCLPWELLVNYLEPILDSDENPWPVLALYSSGSLTSYLLAEAFIIAAVRQHVRQESGGVLRNCWTGIVSFPVLFLWMFVSTFAISFACLFCLLPGVYLNIRWMFVSPVVIFEGTGSQPLKNSWDLTAAHQGFAAAIFLICCIPMIVIVIGLSTLPDFVESLNVAPIKIALELAGDVLVLFVSCVFACAYHQLRQAVERQSQLMNAGLMA